MSDWINWSLMANPYNWGVVLIVMMFIALAGIFVADHFKGSVAE